jgi:tocopherol O-methyltransferase
MIPRASIQSHYDRCSYLYERLWGEHLHHGYWDDGEPVDKAQVRLIEELARAAALAPGSEVLDAGCGLGGSSRWLARELRCRVVGVTLSPVQAKRAQRKSRRAGLEERVSIRQADLETLAWPIESLDAVWSIECTEHLHDKPGFFRKAASWLRPGGKVALCAWTGAENPTPAQRQEFLEPICRGFLCPSLGSAAEYRQWLEAGGLEVIREADLTSRVARTWEICLERTRKPWVRAAAFLLGGETRRFLGSFPLILGAYRAHALHYTLLVARKPA